MPCGLHFLRTRSPIKTCAVRLQTHSSSLPLNTPSSATRGAFSHSPTSCAITGGMIAEILSLDCGLMRCWIRVKETYTRCGHASNLVSIVIAVRLLHSMHADRHLYSRNKRYSASFFAANSGVRQLTTSKIICENRNCKFSDAHPRDCGPPSCLNTCWQWCVHLASFRASPFSLLT